MDCGFWIDVFQIRNPHSAIRNAVFMNAPLVCVTIAFMVGILIGTSMSWVGWVLIGCAVITAAFVFFKRAYRSWALMVLWFIWIGLGMLRVMLWYAHPAERLLEQLPIEQEQVRLHGIIWDDPTEIFSPDEALMQRCAIDVRHIKAGDGWHKQTGRVLATFHDKDKRVLYGDEVIVEGEWLRVPKPGNLGQYDWRASLARLRIHGLLRVRPFDGLVIMKHGQGYAWLALIFKIRQRWEWLIRKHFDEPQAGLLVSLLLGKRVALDDKLKDAFVQTGTIHLLVISGFNVGVIAALLELFLRILGIPWRARLCICALGLGFYALLTGMQPPVVRAMLMAWVVLGALALDRVIVWLNTLAFSALIILWANPMQLFDPSFQLSFGAVISLLMFTQKWTKGFMYLLGWLHPVRFRRYLSIGLGATSSIWVGLSPMLAWYFHIVSPVSMLANLLLAPLMSAMVAFGTSLLMFATVFSAFMRWGSWLLKLLLDATLLCVSWCHTFPFGYWFVAHPSAWLFIGYYGLVGVSVLKRRIGWSTNRIILCWVAGMAAWIWIAVAAYALESRWLRLDFLDVGHGDSIVVRTPGGRTLLVDAGSQEAGRFNLIPFLRFSGISRVDALILTHPDEDHLGGAIPLLENFHIDRLFTNGATDNTSSAHLVREHARANRVSEIVLSSGMTIMREHDLLIEVLHPPRGLVPGSIAGSNDNSIVLKLTKGSVSILLCGDIEEEGLPWLLKERKRLRSSVLQIPHHGSKLGGIGRELFEAVKPRFAILSVGRKHNLPAPETVRAIKDLGAGLLSTRDVGAISLRTDGKRLVIRTYRQHPR